MAADRPRKAAKPKMSEHALHMACAGFMRHALPAGVVWFHVPNGGKRNLREASKLKAMGTLAGVPDFVLVLPNAQTAFLELKADDGRLSEAQIEFRARALAIKAGYEIIRSVEQLEAVLTRWLAAVNGPPLRASTITRAAPLAPQPEGQ